MVAQRRFGPLIGVVGVGLVVLCVRLFQVQIVEHEVWAQQAVGLVRSSRVLPSHRGSILDRNGNLLVRDEDAYRLDFRYRDFRREHPLGVLAHAFASLEMRAVSIAEAHAQRVAWTDTLLGLSPADLDRFERGEELRTPVVLVPRSTTPGTDLRARRAADVRYYIGQLLSSTRTDLGFLRRLEGPARETTYLDAIAERRKLDPSILRARAGASRASHERTREPRATASRGRPLHARGRSAGARARLPGRDARGDRGRNRRRAVSHGRRIRTGVDLLRNARHGVRPRLDRTAHALGRSEARSLGRRARGSAPRVDR